MTISRGLTGMLVAVVMATGAAHAATPAQKCEAAASAGLASCVHKVGGRTRKCYLDTGNACPGADPRTVAALAALETKILRRCPDAATAQAAGFGAFVTPAALVDRLQEACAGEPTSIAARTFGGPLGTQLVGADAAKRVCLETGMKESIKVARKTLKLQSACIRKAHNGKVCDTAATNAEVGAAETLAATTVGAACGDLKPVLGMDATTYAGRAAAQGRCMTATANGDSGPLTLDCGPRTAVAVPPRGTWTQIVLDEATWGTRCGDGSPYAFWLKLAPVGSPVEKVVLDLEGGGVCIAESDCSGVPTSLFQATDNTVPTSGYMSTSASVNPFADWTMVFMPYCTQDVHIGGGLQSVFTSITVNRFGAVNARAALRYLRDAVWATLEAEDAEGYRPDRLQVLFGGESAGAFGVSYNYHYPVDDLRWIHTTGAPDAGLGLDNGQTVGVRTLGILITGETNPFGWGTRPYQPTYCLGSDCAVVPELQAATSPRLKAVPDQQILNISNQVDSTQVSTTFFSSTAAWINALRAAYCTNQGLNGLRFWLPAQTASFHTILRTTSRYTTVTADGVTVRDWLADAMVNPNGVVDRVDEGTLVTDYPGTNPISCLP